MRSVHASQTQKVYPFSVLTLVVLLGVGVILLRQRVRRPITTVSTPVESGEKAPPSGKPPQFVVLSFDGSKSLPMWRDTLRFARDMNTAGKPIHFTYFISGVYFLTPRSAIKYQAPRAARGVSQIGFSDTEADIVARIEELNAAITQGHEIGSHANGHFRGGGWSATEWQQELSQFLDLIFHWKENNGIEGKTDVTLKLRPSDIVTFRAPLLSRNEPLFKALAGSGYLIDSSGVNNTPDAWPTKDAFGIWHADMGNIPVAGTGSHIIAMDYNFFSRETGAKDGTPRASPSWDRYYQEVLTTYTNYFKENYTTTRAPIIIGNHFSTWNNGVYWEALKQFASSVCGLPEVRCTTFRELASYLSTLPTK